VFTEAHQLLAYVDDVNIVGENIYTIKKTTQALLDTNKEVGLEMNPEKTNYMLMSRSQKIGQKQSIKTANRSFEDVVKFKYLGTTLTDQNYMHEEMKSRINSGNGCYHLVQSLLSSCLMSRNVNVIIHKIIILQVVFYACETWSIILSEKHRLRLFENRVLRGIFGPKKDELTGEWRKLYSSPGIIRQIKSRRMRWVGHVARMGEGRNVYRVWVGKPKRKDHLKDQGIDGRMGSKWTLGKLAGGVCVGFTWLRVGTVCRLS
jgi:hypothetical protein